MSKSKIKKKQAKIPLALHLTRLMYNTLGRLFPIYFGNRAYEQWFTTMRFNTPKRELSVLEIATHDSIIVNEIPVAVYIWQHESIQPSKTLLFIHGWTGRGSQIASYVEELTGLGYRIISFDGIAHGKTPGTQTSALEMTDVVLALDKHYGKFDAAITHSFGGMTLACAMSLGLKVDAAAMICPPKDFPIILKNFKRILDLPDSVMQVVIRKSFATHGKIVRDAVDVVKNVKGLSSRDTACKGLVIHDEDDADISWHSGEEIAHAWEGAKFIKTQGLGHRRIIRDKEVISSIINFLKDVA